MSTNREKLLKEWEVHCSYVQQSTPKALGESSQEKKRRINRLLKNYAKFFEYYFPHYCDGGKTKCAFFHIEAAEKLIANREIDLFLNWHRGAAKSTHADIGQPIWLMLQDELHFMLLMGFNETKTKRLLGDIQAELQYNQRIIQDFGKLYNYGNWADGEFKTSKGVLFMSMSILQDPSGLRNTQWRPDYIVFDDFENVKKAKNRVIVKESVHNILAGFKEAMHKGRQRCVYAQNQKVKNGVLDGLMDEIGKKETTHIIEVKPTDKDGMPTWPERYSQEYWIEKKKHTTWRVWMCEYWLEPVEDGMVFRNEWIQWKEMPLSSWSDYDVIVGYGDLSYRANADYKAIKIWGLKVKERQFHLLKSFVRQCDISVAADWLYDFNELLPDNVVINWYVEGNFIQDGFIDDFDEEGEKRGYFVPIVADKRQKPDKFLRVERTAAFYHRAQVFYNRLEKDNNDMKLAVDHLLAFEKGSGAPDDSPDADEGAFYYMMRHSKQSTIGYTVGERKHTQTW